MLRLEALSPIYPVRGAPPSPARMIPPTRDGITPSRRRENRGAAIQRVDRFQHTRLYFICLLLSLASDRREEPAAKFAKPTFPSSGYKNWIQMSE